MDLTMNTVMNDSPSSEEDKKICTDCKTSTTPMWRNGPARKKLCNACGLRQKKTSDLGLNKSSSIKKRKERSNNTTPPSGDKAGEYFPSPNRSNELVQAIPKQKFKLEYFEPRLENGEIVVEPPGDVTEEGIKQWEGCLIGQFIDQKPPLSDVKEFLSRILLKDEQPFIHSLDNGTFIFSFTECEAKNWVLENSPWLVNGCSLFVTKWKPQMETTAMNIDFTRIPIWVKLFNIPTEYWTPKGLSYIASGLGTPLYADNATESMSDMSCARICIEMDAEKGLPDHFLLKIGVKIITINVEYAWRPIKCSSCGIFGHLASTCSESDIVVTGLEIVAKQEQTYV